jgi:hypothetical protein
MCTTAISLCVAPRRPRAAWRHAHTHNLARAQYSGHAPPADALGVKQELERRWRRTASRQNNRPRERHGDNMTGTAQREAPHLGIFWVAQTSNGEARLLAAGCPLDQAEPYGDVMRVEVMQLLDEAFRSLAFWEVFSNACRASRWPTSPRSQMPTIPPSLQTRHFRRRLRRKGKCAHARPSGRRA